MAAISRTISAIALAAVVLLNLACAGGGEGFGARLAAIEGARGELRQELSDSLRAELRRGGAPVVEAAVAHFVWFGPARSIAVAGDMNGWSPDLPLRNVTGTDLWTGSISLPPDARIDYKFVRDGGQWLLDPLNAITMMSGFGPNSELAMPAYRAPAFLSDDTPPPCEIFTYEGFGGPGRRDSRRLRVVVPPGEASGPRPLLVVHDGGEYIDIARLDLALAWLAARGDAGRLPICVCIPPVDRRSEYAGGKRTAYGRFVVETVLPFVEERFPVEPAGAGGWGSMGASYGGQASLNLAASHPAIFRKLALMSPAVAGVPDLDYEHLRVHMAWGSYDIPALLPGCEEFAALLTARGTPHRAAVLSEGHSWGLWRALLPEAIAYLYPAGS